MTIFKFKNIFFLLLLLLVAIDISVNAQKLKGKKKQKISELSASEKTQAEYYFVEGEKYFILDDYSKAFVLFQKAYEISPDNAAINYKLAEVLLKNNEPDKALAFAKKALEKDKKNKYYYLINAEIYTKKSNFKEAAKIYEEMLKSIPGSEEYLFDLASLYIYLQQYNSAIEILNKAQDKFGMIEEVSFQKQRIYLKQNKLKEATAEGQALIDAFPGEDKYVIALADMLASNNKFEEASQKLEKLLKENPSNAVARLKLAEIYKQTNNYEKYEKELKIAFESTELDVNTKVQVIASYYNQTVDDKVKVLLLDLAEKLKNTNPNSANAYAVYGDILIATNKKREACENYKISIKIDGSNFQTWNNILVLESDLGKFDSVIVYGEKALELFPNQGSLYLYIGSAYVRKNNFKEAVKSFEQGKRISGSNAELLNIFNSQLGDAYNGLKEYTKSDAAYEAALNFNPDNDNVLNNYSYYLSLRKEKLEYAKKMSSKLVKRNPDNPSYLDTHAWVLYNLGEYNSALEFLEQALKGEVSGTVIEHYGDVLFKLGRIEEAVIQWQRAKGMNDTSDLIDRKIAERKLYE